MVDESDSHRTHPHCPNCGKCQPRMPFRLLFMVCDKCRKKTEFREVGEEIEFQAWDELAKSGRKLSSGEKRLILEAAEELQALGFSPASFLVKAVRAQKRVSWTVKKRRDRDGKIPDSVATETLLDLLRSPTRTSDVVFSPGFLNTLHILRRSASRNDNAVAAERPFNPEIELKIVAAHLAFAKQAGSGQLLSKILAAMRLSPMSRGRKSAAAQACDLSSWRAYRWALELLLQIDRDYEGKPKSEVRGALVRTGVPPRMLDRFLWMLRSHWARDDGRELRLLTALWLFDLERGIDEAARPQGSEEDDADLSREKKALRRIRALEERFQHRSKD